jgi:hypothetical protein
LSSSFMYSFTKVFTECLLCPTSEGYNEAKNVKVNLDLTVRNLNVSSTLGSGY